MTPLRALLVDDEREFVSTLAERLTLRGIETEWATAAGEALKLAANRCFDVAILDMKMPGIGGLRLKKELQETCPDMRFVFLTGYGSENEFHAVSRQVGENFCLVKPVDIEELIARMVEAFEGGGGKA